MPTKKKRKYTVEELWKPQIDLQSNAAAYGRQSTKEQVIENIQSHISQTVGILNSAKELGFKDDGSTGKVTLFVENEVVDKDGNKTIKNASGTWPIDRRPDLKTIIDLIEDDKIKLVIVEFVDRLFRDEDRIDSNIFIKTCREHDCFVYITSKKMIYNFANPQMAEMFRMEVQFAAAYIDHHVRGTMLRRRDQAVAEGQYGGGFIPTGFVICKDKDSKWYKHLFPYQPHAKVVNEIGEKVLKIGIWEFGRQALKSPIFFPDFEDGVEAGCRALDKVKGGYTIKSISGVIRLVLNPANIGIIEFGSIRVEKAHLPIMDKEVYDLLVSKLRPEEKKRVYYHKSNDVKVGTLKPILTSSDGRGCIYERLRENYYYQLAKHLPMGGITSYCIRADELESLSLQFLRRKCSSSQKGMKILNRCARKSVMIDPFQK